MSDEPIPESLTFDDVLLVPGHSTVVPGDVDVRTRLTFSKQIETERFLAVDSSIQEADAKLQPQELMLTAGTAHSRIECKRTAWTLLGWVCYPKPLRLSYCRSCLSCC